MPISATRKFYVTDGPIPPSLGIANINAAGYDPTDRDRLFMHYAPGAGKITLDMQNDMYGKSNRLGGNYSFDPNGDYLNAGGWDGTHTNPIHPLGSGLDRALSPATGAGGALFGDNLRVGIPRVSAGDNSSAAGSIQCPYGFYQYNNVCVPGVNLDPTNPANTLGINVGNASYQEAKGVILQVIPPVRTQLGALFQVVTQIQNIGHKAGKFYTKVSVPSLGIAETESNAAFVAPGQKTVVYQSLQMPSTVPNDSLLVVKSDLWKAPLDNPTAVPQIQDSNQANLPNPSTTFGMPPPRPPVPQFPISQIPNNTQGFGFPFNPPQPGPQFPRPPIPPGFPQGPFTNPFPSTSYGFSSRAYSTIDGFPDFQGYGNLDPGYVQNLFGNPGNFAYIPTSGYPAYPPGYQSSGYNPAQYNYQQYQYTGDPNYNPTPPPYPIYGDAASPIQTNPYYGNYQYPYQYSQPYQYGGVQQPYAQYPLVSTLVGRCNDFDPTAPDFDPTCTSHIGGGYGTTITDAGAGALGLGALAGGALTSLDGLGNNIGFDSGGNTNFNVKDILAQNGIDPNTPADALGDSIRAKVNSQISGALGGNNTTAGFDNNDVDSESFGAEHHIAGGNHGNKSFVHTHKAKKKKHHKESYFTVNFDGRHDLRPDQVHDNDNDGNRFFNHDNRFDNNDEFRRRVLHNALDHNNNNFGIVHHNNEFFEPARNFGFGFNRFDNPEIIISPHHADHRYRVGTPVSIHVTGFQPGEYAIIQLYVIRSFLGTWRFTQKIGSTFARISNNGNSVTKHLTIPNLRGRTLAVVAIGQQSGERIHTKIIVV